MTTEPRSLFLDRLTGNGSQTPPDTGLLIGRWILNAHSAEVFINSAGASAGDFLVPDGSGLWHLHSGDGLRLNGTAAREQLPDDLEAESVRTIGDRLRELSQSNATWREWLKVVPLVPGISEQADLLPLEQLVRDQIGHLEAVCRKPRAHLHVEVERVPISKARRVHPSAVAYLAAHTEDWDRPLLRGILPKRILGEVRQDRIDIYENRVAARLLDHLGAYLNQRINVVRRLLRVFQEKEDYSGSLVGTYQRELRMSKLWGESIDANEGRKKAETSLRELERLKYKLMGLLGSPLYEEVPRRAFVPTTLKSTNILVNDQHYRRVADLWREWALTGAGRSRSPNEIYQDGQRLTHGLDAFTMLLTIRALDTLSYEPTAEAASTPISPGATVRLQGNGIEFLLNWQKDGSTAVRFGERTLTMVSLPADLGAGQDGRVRASLDRIRSAVRDRSTSDVLVLFLSSEDDQGNAAADVRSSLHTVGNDPRHQLAGGRCLPVSPWVMGSTERVARALRWFLSGTRFLDYPHRVAVPDAARGLIPLEDHSTWMRAQRPAVSIELHRPPETYEWDSLGLASAVANAESALQIARTTHQDLTDRLRVAVRARKTGSLARQKSDAHKEVLRCREVHAAVQEVAHALERARARTVGLLDCPACGKSASASRDFLALDGGCFLCSCADCGTEWGVRLCSQGHRYSTMLPSGEFTEAEGLLPGWESRTYGCDILALPARDASGQWGFVCPTCGTVG